MYKSRNADGSGARGFTLVEIIVVVILLGLLVGMVAMSIGPTRGSTVRQAARMIAADLEYVQSQAQRRQESLTVDFNVVGTSYRVYDSNGDPLTLPIGSGVFERELSKEFENWAPDINAVDFGGGCTAVTYTPEGEPTQAGTANVPISNNSAIELESGDYMYTLRITPVTGLIKIEASMADE